MKGCVRPIEPVYGWKDFRGREWNHVLNSLEFVHVPGIRLQFKTIALLLFLELPTSNKLFMIVCKTG